MISVLYVAAGTSAILTLMPYFIQNRQKYHFHIGSIPLLFKTLILSSIVRRKKKVEQKLNLR